jgi:dolichol-phosphate mannosyltransferase
MRNLGSESNIPTKLSVVIPCYNEEKTLKACVESVLALRNEDLAIEIVIVDDCSKDRSLEIAQELESQHRDVRVLHHARNQGKGAALRTGFQGVTGDFVAVQDADLEYDPQELKSLIEPLRDGRADVVVGSRFLGGGCHRVLYFWHSMGNAFLTFLSNMFTDLSLTDMETCYKVFKRSVIQNIAIQENRFGFEPEIVAKIAHRNLRIYEMAISYRGRTYEEGKKITWKDGVRALYCIFRYNSQNFPLPIQFLVYLAIGATSAIVNLALFMAVLALSQSLTVATVSSFVVAAAVNYFLCIWLLFKHNSRWNSAGEVLMYILVVVISGGLDLGTTVGFYGMGASPWLAKTGACMIGLVFNFLARRYLVFGKGNRPFIKATQVEPVVHTQDSVSERSA